MEHLWLVTLKRGFYRLEPGVVISSVYGWDLFSLYTWAITLSLV